MADHCESENWIGQWEGGVCVDQILGNLPVVIDLSDPEVLKRIQCKSNFNPCELHFISDDGFYLKCDNRSENTIEEFPGSNPFIEYDLILSNDTVFANIFYKFADGINLDCSTILSRKD